MPRVRTIQTNFTGGEASPKLRGRVEIPRYLVSCEILKNVIVFSGAGGVTRSPGKRFIYNAGAGITVRLIRFTILKKEESPATTQGYVVEFRSDNKIRFYTNNSIIKNGDDPVEIDSPFHDTDLKKIRYEQHDGVLYLVHPDFPPHQLTRTSDTQWAINAVVFQMPAEPHWNPATGYPTAIVFFEQRMMIGGTKEQPTTIWGSKSGDITNLNTGVVDIGDSDPFEFTLAAATTGIRHMVATKHITVYTFDKELFVKGTSDKPITPTNVQVTEQTTSGCSETVKPLVVAGEHVFVSRHSKKLKAMRYKMEIDSYMALDQSFISEHLVSAGIWEMTCQQDPDSILWVITNDGKFCAVTYDLTQDIVAWARQETDGSVKSVVSIPYDNKDQVWLSVERTVNGTTYTYIETLDESLNTDAAYVGTDAVGKDTWDGLDYLEGKTVDIVADGAVMPQRVVAGGQVILPRAANEVEIGLHYESVIKDLPPEFQTPIGTAQGMDKSVQKVIVRLYESLGCVVNDETIPFRKFGVGILDEVVEPFTGDKSVSQSGWSEDGTVTIKQVQPLPFTVLAIVKEVNLSV